MSCTHEQDCHGPCRRYSVSLSAKSLFFTLIVLHCPSIPLHEEPTHEGCELSAFCDYSSIEERTALIPLSASTGQPLLSASNHLAKILKVFRGS